MPVAISCSKNESRSHKSHSSGGGSNNKSKPPAAPRFVAQAETREIGICVVCGSHATSGNNDKPKAGPPKFKRIGTSKIPFYDYTNGAYGVECTFGDYKVCNRCYQNGNHRFERRETGFCAVTKTGKVARKLNAPVQPRAKRQRTQPAAPRKQQQQQQQKPRQQLVPRAAKSAFFPVAVAEPPRPQVFPVVTIDPLYALQPLDNNVWMQPISFDCFQPQCTFDDDDNNNNNNYHDNSIHDPVDFTNFGRSEYSLIDFEPENFPFPLSQPRIPVITVAYDGFSNPARSLLLAQEAVLSETLGALACEIKLQELQALKESVSSLFAFANDNIVSTCRETLQRARYLRNKHSYDITHRDLVFHALGSLFARMVDRELVGG